jgi:hypothetical protein
MEDYAKTMAESRVRASKKANCTPTARADVPEKVNQQGG